LIDSEIYFTNDLYAELDISLFRG